MSGKRELHVTTKLSIFVAVLTAAFELAWFVGSSVEPLGPGPYDRLPPVVPGPMTSWNTPGGHR